MRRALLGASLALTIPASVAAGAVVASAAPAASTSVASGPKMHYESLFTAAPWMHYGAHPQMFHGAPLMFLDAAPGMHYEARNGAVLVVFTRGQISSVRLG